MPRPMKKNGIKKEEQIVTMSIQQIYEHMANQSKERSQIPTPKDKVKRKGDGFDYVDEAYMRDKLTEYFPTWSWIASGNKPVEFLGSEWVVVSGELVIEDNGKVRRFFSPGSARIQFKKGQPHTPENVVDIDKNVGAANSYAFKRAVNRLCRIADDVYKKVDLSLTDEQKQELNDFITKNKVGKNVITNIKAKINKGVVNNQTFPNLMKQMKTTLQIKETK